MVSAVASNRIKLYNHLYGAEDYPIQPHKQILPRWRSRTATTRVGSATAEGRICSGVLVVPLLPLPQKDISEGLKNMPQAHRLRHILSLSNTLLLSLYEKQSISIGVELALGCGNHHLTLRIWFERVASEAHPLARGLSHKFDVT